MRILTVLVPLALIATPAAAQPRVGEVIGPDRAKAEAALAAQGYKVVAFEVEDGRLEVKAVRKSPAAPERIEVLADARTGKVTRVEGRDGDRR